MPPKHWEPGKGIYPTQFLIALFEDRPAAEHAIQNLKNEDFLEADIIVFHGKEGYEEIKKYEGTGKFQQFLFSLQDGTLDEKIGRRQYLDALQQGRSNVLVYAPDQKQRDRAQEILKAASGYGINYLGRWAITPE